MGFFDKLTFWRKKDELGLDNLQIPTAGFGSQPGGFPQQGFPQQGFPGQDPYAPQGINTWQQPQQFQSYQPQAFQSQPFQSPPAQMDSFQSSASYTQGRQLELVSAKLDAIKAALDALNQRMANMEKAKESEEYFRKRGGGW